MKKFTELTLLIFVLTVTNSLFSQQIERVVELNQPEIIARDVNATSVIHLLPGFQSVLGFSAKIVEENWYNQVVGNPYNLNENRNWVSTTSYDLEGRLTSSGVAYFNTLGKATQNQSLDIKTGKIWASEVRYDEFGRPVFSSLSAPVDSLNYGYDVTFLTKKNGSLLSDEDVASIINDGSDVQMSTQKNKLGWYYSEANTSEEYQDVTKYPYSKTIYSTLNPGLPLKTLGGNKVKRTLGSSEEWLQSYSFNMPLTQEMFRVFGLDYFPQRDEVVEIDRLNGTGVINYNYRYIYTIKKVTSNNCNGATPINDVEINANLLTNKIYKLYYNGDSSYYRISAKYTVYRSNGGATLEKNSNEQRAVLPPPDEPIDDGGSYDYASLIGLSSYHCPLGTPNYIRGTKTVVRDVHGVESVVFKDSEGNVLAAARSGNEEDNTLATRTVLSPIGQQGYVDIHIPVGCGGTVYFRGKTGGIYKIYNLITDKLLTTTSANSRILTPGMYRIQVQFADEVYKPKNPYAKFTGGTPTLLDPNNTVGVEYKVNYYDYSINYYDKANRLVKSTQPLSTNLQSTFKYNTLGQLLETSSPDEGKAEFKYRKDGQIRFSQNTKQKGNGEFSYTNYDGYGRPIESGVAVGNFETLNVESDGFSGTRKEQHFTLYDEADKKGLTEALSRANYGTNAANYKQQFVAGNVSKTHTENPKTTTTWYSYDVYGRVTWIIQDIEGLGVKSIDYIYDFGTGQVTNVIYQKYHNQQTDNPRDYFEHKYTYNVAGELYKVETTTAVNAPDSAYTEQARYYYYETGALKRVQIAEDLQGIDYVYNLNGQLKAINHPSTSSSLDPGKDGVNGVAQDLFGFAIDYYNGDYTRTNTPTPVVSAQGLYANNQYNGNIKATRWATSGINNTNQASQLFSYNKNNWLQSADFGSANNSGTITTNSHNNYRVFDISYDANGNIQTLNRNMDGIASTNPLDRLTYNYDDYKQNQLTSVNDAVTTGLPDDIENQAENNYIYNTIGQLVVNKQDNAVYKYNASGLVTNIDKLANSSGANTSVYPIFNENFEQYTAQTSGTREIPGGPISEIVFTGWFFTNNQGKSNGSLLVYKEPNNSYSCTEVRNKQGNMLQVKMKEPSLATENISIKKQFRLVGGVTNTLSFNIIKRKQEQNELSTVSITQYPLQVQVKDKYNTVLASTVVNPVNSYSLCGNYQVQPISFTIEPEQGKDVVTLEITMLADNNQQTTFYIDDEQVSLLTQPEVAFYYNDKGHRVRKEAGLSNAYIQTTYYVRDAAGSPLAIVNMPVGKTVNNPITEYPIYGASRLGVYNKETNHSVYQLTDHLGNVRAVLAKDASGNEAAITTATDYYPFGMPMPNRQIVNGEPYRYAYQGQEKDPETGKEAFQLRLWDGRIGRWLTTDPKGEFSSPYLGMGNNPMSKIDPDGGSTEDEKRAVWNSETQQYDVTTIGTLGGDKFDVIHYEGGALDNRTEITSGGFSVFLKQGVDVIKNFTMRGDDVYYKTIYDEFVNGTGPKRSLMGEDHSMTKDMKLSYVAYMAREKYMNNGGKKAYIPVDFGVSGILRSNVNMTEQMIGSAGVSIYPLGDNVVFMIVDTKTPRSLFYHLPGVRARYNRDLNARSIKMPYSETKQTYIWIESVKTLQKNHYIYDTNYDSDW